MKRIDLSFGAGPWAVACAFVIAASACQEPTRTPLTPEAAAAAIVAEKSFLSGTPDLQVPADRARCELLFRPPASERLEEVVGVSEGVVSFRTRQPLERRILEVRSVGASMPGQSSVPVLFTWQWSWDGLPPDLAACVVRKTEIGTAMFESTAGGWTLKAVNPISQRQ